MARGSSRPPRPTDPNVTPVGRQIVPGGDKPDMSGGRFGPVSVHGPQPTTATGNRFSGGGTVAGRGNSTQPPPVGTGAGPQKGGSQPMPSPQQSSGGKGGASTQSMPPASGRGGGGYGGSYNDLTRGSVNANRGGPAYTGNISPVDVNVEGLGLERYQQFADDAYESQLRRLDPAFESADARFRQQMVNQGLSEGTEAYDAARANFDRDRTDAYGQARTLADQMGMQMQAQAFGQNLSESQLANALQQAQMQMNATLGAAGMGARASMYGSDVQRYLGQLNNQLGWGNLASGHQLGLGQLELGQGQLDLGNRNSDQNFMLGLGGLGLDAFNGNQGAQNNWFNQGLGMFGLVPGQAPAQLDAYGPYRDNYLGRQNQYAQNRANDQQQQQFWTSFFMCDRAAKDTLGDIAPEAMLQAVVAMPVDRWRYKHDGSEHVGPYAQPFYAALGLPERKTIDPVDAFGVVLGAIKALARRLDALEAA